MDEFERLLTEKIQNARKDAEHEFLCKNTSAYIVAVAEKLAYMDALNEYKTLKAKKRLKEKDDETARIED